MAKHVTLTLTEHEAALTSFILAAAIEDETGDSLRTLTRVREKIKAAGVYTGFDVIEARLAAEREP